MKYLEKYTDKELDNFKMNPEINPKTKRKIKLNGTVYNNLMKLLHERDKNKPPKPIVKKLREKSIIPE